MMMAMVIHRGGLIRGLFQLREAAVLAVIEMGSVTEMRERERKKTGTGWTLLPIWRGLGVMGLLWLLFVGREREKARRTCESCLLRIFPIHPYHPHLRQRIQYQHSPALSLHNAPQARKAKAKARYTRVQAEHHHPDRHDFQTSRSKSTMTELRVQGIRTRGLCQEAVPALRRVPYPALGRVPHVLHPEPVPVHPVLLRESRWPP